METLFYVYLKYMIYKYIHIYAQFKWLFKKQISKHYFCLLKMYGMYIYT